MIAGRTLDALLARTIVIAEELDAVAGATEPDLGHAPWDEFQRTMEAQLREELANVCFGGAIELRQMRRQIEAAGEQEIERQVACESAARKLRRVIGAILEAAERVCDEPVPRVLPPEEELEGALAVRRL